MVNMNHNEYVSRKNSSGYEIFVPSFLPFKEPFSKTNKERRLSHCTFRIEYEIYWNEVEKKICCIVNIRRPTTHVTQAKR